MTRTGPGTDVARRGGVRISLDFLPILAGFALCLLLIARLLPLGQSGDGILLSIMSLQKITVYFWGQDRFGNLSPLLAAGFRDPLWNAWAQLGLRLVAGLTAPLFFCALAFRRPIEIFRATLIGDLVLLCTGGGSLLHEIFVEANPYGLSLACAGLASLTARRRGMAMAALTFGALLAAYVVNVGLVIVTLPLAALFALARRSAGASRLAALHVGAAGCAFLLPRLVARDISRTPFGLRVAIDPLLRYGDVIWGATGWMFVLAAALPVGALLLRQRFGRNATRSLVPALGAMAIVAFGNFAVVASSRWLAMNGFHIRYAIPGLLLLASVAGMGLWALVRTRRARNAAFAATIAGLALLAAQRPREAGAGSGIVGHGKAALAQAVAERVVARSLDAIVGEYWDVWPSVLLAAQIRYDAGDEGAPVLGVTYRGERMLAAFQTRLARGGVRLACLDLATDACVARAESVMGLSGLRATEIAPAETVAGDHLLGFIAVAAAK